MPNQRLEPSAFKRGPGGRPTRQEAERGTYDAGYCFYTLGKLQILKLRQDYRRLGFRDFVFFALFFLTTVLRDAVFFFCGACCFGLGCLG